MLKGGERGEKKPAWLDAGGVESWNVKLGSDVCFWAFHLSSTLSAPSLELGLFIRGWRGSWIPQCEIGRDANPDRLVIKKSSERKKTLSRRRVGGAGEGRSREDETASQARYEVRQDVKQRNLWPRHPVSCMFAYCWLLSGLINTVQISLRNVTDCGSIDLWARQSLLMSCYWHAQKCRG